MNTATTRDEYAAFREELRAFAQTACPPEIRRKVARGDKLGRAELNQWQKIMHAQGWAAPNWPREHGGTGWNLKQRLIFEEEMAEADCPPLFHHGIGHLGPVLIHFGTPQQKAHFLPRILDGTDWWCQGYSEPNSGSDLASLRTAAEAQGDEYVVNGQKIWTSHAHEADWIYLLVRTSREARKQDGISLLLVPLDSPGISIRPIRTIDGWHHVNEVFFENVRVPRENLVGEEGKGWQCAKYLLERERLPPASVARLAAQWRRVRQLLQANLGQRAARQLDTLRYELLVLEGDLRGAREMLASATDDLMHQRPLGAKPSALKLRCSEIAQKLSEIAFELVGPAQSARFMADGAPPDDDAVWVHTYLFYRSRTIAGGTSEVQRNVIARDLFGA